MSTRKKTHETFKFKVTLKVSQNWIDDGANREDIAERLKEYLEEEMNGWAYEGEYIAEVE